ncbi:MAG: tetratricopeptide repeat protein [Solirubrobacteraceae bacterium]
MANFRAAAAKHDTTAESWLGFMYFSGHGALKNYTKAVKWYRLAAAQGNADAQLGLGVAYFHGQGVPQDYTKAVKWYRLAAVRGNADAQLGLGLAYFNGQGVPQDYTKAVKWYRLAAVRGNADAQRDLGLMYANGLGVPQNLAKAMKWTRLAGAQGNVEAQNNLRRASANSHGVSQDHADGVCTSRACDERKLYEALQQYNKARNAERQAQGADEHVSLPQASAALVMHPERFRYVVGAANRLAPVELQQKLAQYLSIFPEPNARLAAAAIAALNSASRTGPHAYDALKAFDCGLSTVPGWPPAAGIDDCPHPLRRNILLRNEIYASH